MAVVGALGAGAAVVAVAGSGEATALDLFPLLLLLWVGTVGVTVAAVLVVVGREA